MSYFAIFFSFFQVVQATRGVLQAVACHTNFPSHFFHKIQKEAIKIPSFPSFCGCPPPLVCPPHPGGGSRAQNESVTPEKDQSVTPPPKKSFLPKGQCSDSDNHPPLLFRSHRFPPRTTLTPLALSGPSCSTSFSGRVTTHRRVRIIGVYPGDIIDKLNRRNPRFARNFVMCCFEHLLSVPHVIGKHWISMDSSRFCRCDCSVTFSSFLLLFGNNIAAENQSRSLLFNLGVLLTVGAMCYVRHMISVLLGECCIWVVWVVGSVDQDINVRRRYHKRLFFESAVGYITYII